MGRFKVPCNIHVSKGAHITINELNRSNKKKASLNRALKLLKEIAL